MKKNKGVSREADKEKLFKELSAELSARGYTVRREKLKQGYGWKVLSGSCTALGKRLVFVDQRMSQDDQIAFLRAKLELPS